MNAEVFEGGALDYVLVTPDGFVADGSWPLVIMLHGFGAHMYDLSSLGPAIDDSGYVYAFPNAPYGLVGMGGFSWSANRPGAIESPGPPRSVEERLGMLRESVAPLSGATIEVDSFSGLLVNYAADRGIRWRHRTSQTC